MEGMTWWEPPFRKRYSRLRESQVAHQFKNWLALLRKLRVFLHSAIPFSIYFKCITNNIPLHYQTNFSDYKIPYGISMSSSISENKTLEKDRRFCSLPFFSKSSIDFFPSLPILTVSLLTY